MVFCFVPSFFLGDKLAACRLGIQCAQRKKSLSLRLVPRDKFYNVYGVRIVVL